LDRNLVSEYNASFVTGELCVIVFYPSHPRSAKVNSIVPRTEMMMDPMQPVRVEKNAYI
jgi:hypothetical protein